MTESVNFTIIQKPADPPITNSFNETWTLVASGNGQVAVGGVPDATTANVVQIEYYNGLVYQSNVAGGWWSKSRASDAWTPTTAPPSISTHTIMQAAIAGAQATMNTVVSELAALYTKVGQLLDPVVTVPTESANPTVINTAGPMIIDAAGNTWALQASATVPPFVILLNGAVVSFTANVVALALVNHVLWQRNAANNWYSLGVAGGVAVTLSGPLTTSPLPAESPDQTDIKTTGPTIIDSLANTWARNAALQLTLNGAVVSFATAVAEFCYVAHVVWYRSGTNWYSIGSVGGVATILSGPITTSPLAVLGNIFTVRNGQILDPAGVPFFAKGLAVAVDILQGTAIANLTTGAPLTTSFPKANIIRIACYQPPPYPTSAQLAPYVNCLTNLGKVCLIEDHSGVDGGAGQMFTGARLAQQQAFYADMANAFKNNSHVWLCTLNEPSNDTQGTVTANEVLTYNTIRATGFANIIGLQQVGGGIPSIEGANNPAGLWPDSAYLTMRNVTMNPHYYPYMTNNSGDVNVINGVIMQIFGLCQQIQSADGVVPVIFDEFGVTVGATPDSNGPSNAGQMMALVDAHSVHGAIAWEWGPYPAGNAMHDYGYNLTAWGQQVSAWLS